MNTSLDLNDGSILYEASPADLDLERLVCLSDVSQAHVYDWQSLRFVHLYREHCLGPVVGFVLNRSART